MPEELPAVVTPCANSGFSFMNDMDYTARIDRSDVPGWPYAVVVKAHDGEEIARKSAKTEHEAQAFLD